MTWTTHTSPDAAGNRFLARGAAAAMLVLSIAAAAFAPSPAQAGFQPPRDCRSGTTIFRDGPVRLLRIAGSVDGEQAWRHYVCSATIRTPKRFNETSPGSDETLSAFRRSGRRVAYVTTVAGGESFDQALGWVDLRTGLRRLAWIRARDEGPTVLAVAAGERGGIAYLQDSFDDGAQRIGYARLRPDGRLAVPRPRARVEGSRVIPSSLAVSHGRITWETRAGESGSVATEG
jgi:hypothetical protein